MYLYYVADTNGFDDLLTSEFEQAYKFFQELLDRVFEYKDGIDIDEDRAYLYKIDSTDLLGEAIKTENTYIEDLLEDEKISTLIAERYWVIDEEETKEYLNNYKEQGKNPEYSYMCRQVEKNKRNSK